MTEKQRRRNNAIHTASLFSGLILSVFGVKLYGHTFIEVRFIFTAVLLFSTLGYFVVFRTYGKTYPAQSGFAIGQSLVTFGCGITALLVILNFHFSTPPRQSFDFNILETGRQGRRHGGQPYGYVQHRGMRKRIVFGSKYQINLKDRIKLVTEQGFLGFEVVKSKEIVR